MNARTSADVRPPIVGASAVAVGIADFLVRTEQERLRLFRLHLQASITRISPLLPDLAALEGIRLANVVALLYPPQDWPWRPLADLPPGFFRRAMVLKAITGGMRAAEARRFARTFSSPGIVVRPFGHPSGAFALRPVGRVLGFSAVIGASTLSAFGTNATLKLSDHVPETVLTAMPGRPVDQLVAHPILTGRNYRVVRVEPDLNDGFPVLTFRAPVVAFAMPGPLRDCDAPGWRT